MKKKTVSKLKKEADRVFSIFIRKRDKRCFTCGRIEDWKRLQCGQFVSRARSITRYDELNCHAQCRNCNVWRHGNYAEYSKRLIDKYGLDKFNELVKKGRQTHQFTIKELEEIIDRYNEL